MKKILTAIILILVIALSFTSCDKIKEEASNPTFDLLNELVKAEFANYSIDVSLTDKNSHTLNESYTVVTDESGLKTITYTVERLNKFTLNGSVTAPNSYKSELSGTAVVDGENLIKQDGDDVGIDFAEIKLPSFNFTGDALENAMVVNDDTLMADVTNQEQFLGFTLTNEAVQIMVEFSETAISYVTLTFVTSNGNDATVVYSFN